MNDKPEPKDHMMAIVTVSTVLLALTPVFLAIQPSRQVVAHNTLIILYAFLSLSFILGLIAIANAVDWFDKPLESRKRYARCFLIIQTLVFSFSSFVLLYLNLFSN